MMRRELLVSAAVGAGLGAVVTALLVLPVVLDFSDRIDRIEQTQRESRSKEEAHNFNAYQRCMAQRRNDPWAQLDCESWLR